MAEISPLVLIIAALSTWVTGKPCKAGQAKDPMPALYPWKTLPKLWPQRVPLMATAWVPSTQPQAEGNNMFLFRAG